MPSDEKKSAKKVFTENADKKKYKEYQVNEEETKMSKKSLFFSMFKR